MEPKSNFLEMVRCPTAIGAGLLTMPEPSRAVVSALSVKLAESGVKTLDQKDFGYILACIFVTNLSRAYRFTGSCRSRSLGYRSQA